MLFSASTILPLISVAAAQYGSSDYGSSSDTSVVASQYGSSSSSDTTSNSQAATDTTTDSSGATVHKVLVGQTALKFTPWNLTAAVGDKVEFHFYPTTHSVAQAAFDKPCQPSSDTAFFSGGVTTQASGKRRRQDTAAGDMKIFTVTVNDTKPIWYYCAFPNHCQGGMVGVINQAATGEKTIEAFAAAAKDVETTVAPAKVQGGTWGAAEASTGTETGGASTPSQSTGAAAGLMERGSYSTVVAAGLVAAMAGLVGTLLV
ncbi:hypothetical protein V498_00898 [Pseudogymnoascus sp. VKM F-4517 (FW-2822)]|nr:hypothetical protein V498_00898 [Pseudogymnoascus sp. VKM F-4517 (FW-2822)]